MTVLLAGMVSLHLLIERVALGLVRDDAYLGKQTVYFFVGAERNVEATVCTHTVGEDVGIGALEASQNAHIIVAAEHLFHPSAFFQFLDSGVDADLCQLCLDDLRTVGIGTAARKKP